MDNIYTGTPDTFEDVNPQQEQALYREKKHLIHLKIGNHLQIE